MRHRLADEDPRDEGPLADLTSGALWTTAGVVGTLALLLPGAERDHLVWALGIAALATAWGLVSFVLWHRRLTMSIGRRAVVTAASLPLVGVALWATGGKESFVQPFMLFTALFIAYFFPPRFGWPLTGLFVATYASPLLYESADGYPSRVLTFAAAVAGMNVAIHLLKDRLLHAEARQRVMAERDPLTGLANRRTPGSGATSSQSWPPGPASPASPAWSARSRPRSPERSSRPTSPSGRASPRRWHRSTRSRPPSCSTAPTSASSRASASGGSPREPQRRWAVSFHAQIARRSRS